MSRRDRIRQALNWWCSAAPLRRGWTERNREVAKAYLVHKLRRERP